MTARARRGAITTHPAFRPLISLWFAALFGLGVAVLPAALLEQTLAGAGLAELAPPTAAGRATASAAAALIGGVFGLALAILLARRGGGDPRPLYAESDLPDEDTSIEERVRRPLRVREELDEEFGDGEFGDGEFGDGEFGDGADEVPAGPSAQPVTVSPTPVALPDEGFMILTPQPIHPPRPAPDLEALLEQFDGAFESFRAGEGKRAPAEHGADPVRAFVARQTGANTLDPPHGPAASPLGGLVPDHQAELRAALEKLARRKRGD